MSFKFQVLSFKRLASRFLNFRVFFVILLFSIFCFLFSGYCNAAVLYLEPENGGYEANDTFVVDVRIDTEKECINAIKAQINFSPEILKIIDFSTGNSFLVVWLEPPEINQEAGTVSFTGGIPGGHCGKLPGDPSEINLLGKIIVQAKVAGEAEIVFSDDSRVFLNDGLGTPAGLTFKNAVFDFSEEKSAQSKNEWQKELAADKVPPEPFEVEINKDPEIFKGKYFIVFYTTDKQTGIDYYEIKEGNRIPKKITPPYLLEDQDLKSIIEIKAVDKAGNERIVKIMPKAVSVEKDSLLKYVFSILLLAGAITVWRLIKKKKNK